MPNLDIFAEERKQTILKLLKDQKRITVPDLMELFKTSGTTIRRYLNDLEKSGRLIRTHGGAICTEGADVEEAFTAKSEQRIALKRRIAREARKLISDGDIVMLGGGTTVLELARILHDAGSLIAITDSVPAAAELYSDKKIEVQLCGGTIRETTGVVVGPFPEKFIEEMHAQKTFIGADSLSLENGLTTPNYYEAQVERQLMKHGKTVYVLADHTKMRRVSLARQATLQEINYLITDDGTDPEFIRALESAGVTVIVA
jgi:DeoR family transcriptional regulator, fructose operon transcriptional repressor